ncbi:Crp/Fnr family transcriptional regulator [Methylorubrum sp. DB1722]|uniref:Crp/Fnr family transcriptional regulator n=1 Tax=Methylorubrum sp. DB1722 TaxID=2478916 RepID=UPI0018E3EC0D|nr:Crp/Fnr family transcriptional regulator [Methylorubrum sp. DB1722]MBI1692053.1 Crp/Fnr family transcriptional regulator [Methylorubrum sp. DB1722]
MSSLQSPISAPLHRSSPEYDGAIDPFAARLTAFAPLSGNDRAALAELVSRAAAVASHTDLVRDGEVADVAFLVLDGIACRYLQKASGARQILALLLPGDLCDSDLIHLERWDHGIATLSSCRVARVPRAMLEDLIITHPTIELALRRARLEAEARGRGWLAALGVCSATERLARLFYEIAERLHAVGHGERHACTLRLTQLDLAECIGVTTVHVSRVLRELRQSGVIEFKGGQLRLLDRAGLAALAAS